MLAQILDLDPLQIAAVFIMVVLFIALIVALVTAPECPDEQISAGHLAELNREDGEF